MTDKEKYNALKGAKGLLLQVAEQGSSIAINDAISSINCLLEGLEPPHEFKPYERVLVRSYDDTTWKAALFSHVEESEGRTVYNAGGSYWNYCIPYKGNESLLGTK